MQRYIDIAIAHLDEHGGAVDALDGDYVYRAEETGEDYRVTGDELESLGRMLDEKVDDAYSLWCAEGGTVLSGPGRLADNIRRRELLGLCIHAGGNGDPKHEDYDAGVILAVRRDFSKGLNLEAQVRWAGAQCETWHPLGDLHLLK